MSEKLPPNAHLDLKIPEERPVWNLHVLVFFWSAQFIILGLRQAGDLFLILFSPATDAHSLATMYAFRLFIISILLTICQFFNRSMAR